jgi:tetratricopeptide (TPR) repeat protein
MALTLSFTACKQKAQEGGVPSETEVSPTYTEQTRMIEDALRNDPNNRTLLVQLGNLYYDWGQEEVTKKGELAQPTEKWSKAVDFYKRALAVEPSDVNVRVDMANLLRFMGRGDEAIAEYRQALNIDPKHPQARINLVLALAELKKDYKGAVNEYGNLIRILPDQAQNLELKKEVEGYKEQMKGAKK